jgi:hypothetical protein
MISEMTRLEAVLQVARDDLVRRAVVGDRICCLFSPSLVYRALATTNSRASRTN